MLTAGIMLRRLFATFTALLLAAPSAFAQTPGAGPGTLPDAGRVVSAYLTVARWLQTYDPPDVEDEAARLDIPDASGVCIQLRLRGRVIGTGLDLTGSDTMVRRAAGRAMAAVLGDRTIANLPEDLRDDVGAQLTMELEVAGPLLPMPGRSFAEIAEQIAPGLDGIALRRGERRVAIFPAQLRATNTADSLQGVLPGLAVDLGVPVKPLMELRERFGVQAYRFRTIHLVQRAPGRIPMETFRGQTLIAPGDVTVDSIVRLGEGLVDHLITALWSEEPLGVRGEYRPTADRYDPVAASPLEQALTALALVRFASAPQLTELQVERARSTAGVILQDLAVVADGEASPLDDPTACAAIVLALSADRALLEDPGIAALRAPAVAQVRTAYQVGLGFVGHVDDRNVPLAMPAHGRALVAAALARLWARGEDQIDRAHAREAADAAWQSVDATQVISLLPWIGSAELDLAAAPENPAAPLERLVVLMEILDAARIGAADRPGPPDLDGGFALRGRSARLARADAQSARPAAYVALMLRQDAVVPLEARAAATGRHLRTVRFLMQLAIDDTLLWSVRTPQRAKGGVRASTWNSNQPAAAQAMGLLTVAETLISLDAMRAGASDH